MPEPISRRDLLLAGGASAITALVPAMTRPRPFRVAHLTDVHIQRELYAVEGTRAAFRHAMSATPRPELMLVGGDLVMDAFAHTKSRVRSQWRLYREILLEHTDVPIRHAIGNHDVWGWDKKHSRTTGSERLWGKKWFLEFFHLTRTYSSFDAGGWHFVILDNILLTPDGYNGMVDHEQFEWLRDDLSKTTRPTLIMSHIPLLSILPVVTGYNVKTGEWNVGGDLMTKNVDELRVLFERNPQVKLALSGHIHMVDRVDYKGVTYLCSGAVCGNWWRGANQGHRPGYRILDLYPDGRFDEQYHAWGS